MLEIPNEIKNLLESSIIAFGTSDPQGQPNVVAVACCRVVSPNQLLITDNFMNKTRHNLATNNQVSLAFWNLEQSLEGAGYQFKGTAEVITQGKYKEMVDTMECNQGLAHKAAILVTITEIWDLANPKLISKTL